MYYSSQRSFYNEWLSMKSYRKELWFNVPGRRAFINITPQVEECLREVAPKRVGLWINCISPRRYSSMMTKMDCIRITKRGEQLAPRTRQPLSSQQDGRG